MKLIKITNTSRVPRTVELDHAIMCGRGPCGCTRIPRAKLNFTADGNPTAYATQKHPCPAVVTLLPGVESEALAPRVQTCRDFQAQKKFFKVVEVEVEGERPVLMSQVEKIKTREARIAEAQAKEKAHMEGEAVKTATSAEGPPTDAPTPPPAEEPAPAPEVAHPSRHRSPKTFQEG